MEDAGRLAEIQTCGWRYAYRGIISDTELFCKRTVCWATEKFEQRIQDQETIYISTDPQEIILGFAWHGDVKDEQLPISHELYAIYVQPEFSHLGVGTELINSVICHSKELGKTELLVWLLEKNNIGKSFYEKTGFCSDGRQKLVTEWNENEIRMKKIF